jgi:AAA family ATP:ADP antiporter
MNLKFFRNKFNEIEAVKRKDILLATFSLFFVMFSYPAVRSTTKSIFLVNYGAKSSPHVWIYSVLTLMVIVTIFNSLQKMKGVKFLYSLVSIFTFLLFCSSLFFISKGLVFFSFVLFIWKEVYIVLVVHMIMGHLNTNVTSGIAKTFYGPIGAIASLGGVLGAIATKNLTFVTNTETILVLGGLIIPLSGLIFYNTSDPQNNIDSLNGEKKVSPFKSIGNVKKYVFLISVIILLSQFCINITTFKFNLVFDELISGKNLKTRYLGDLYTYMNGVSFLAQLVLVPIINNYFSNRSVHILVPALYGVVTMAAMSFGIGSVMPMAVSLVLYKGLDYSLFTVAKELLYFKLSDQQKYGAKYIIDVVVYRLGKGLISFVLIFVQDLFWVNILLYTFLLSWPLTLFMLFKEQKRLVLASENSNESIVREV